MGRVVDEFGRRVGTLCCLAAWFLGHQHWQYCLLWQFFLFNPLRARSLTSWCGDTSAAACLDHYDAIFDDMLCVIANLRNMWRSIIAAIQPSLVLYMSLHVLSGWNSQCQPSSYVTLYYCNDLIKFDPQCFSGSLIMEPCCQTIAAIQSIARSLHVL